MKAVAAARIAQYERSVEALADYRLAVELGLGVSLRQVEAASEPIGLRSATGSGGVGAIVFGSDQGLVGQFNDAIADRAVKALTTLPGPARIWAVGERVQARLADAGVATTGTFAVPTSVSAITELVAQILVATDASDMQRRGAGLYLFYNEPTVGAIYAPATEHLLPLGVAWRRTVMQRHWPSHNLPEVLGAGATTPAALIGEYLFICLFRACAESLASENASRLAAMQRAEKNIDELLHTMQATFHRLRQNSIDEELFDVVSGFEAVSE